jgi:hypothetical protein
MIPIRKSSASAEAASDTAPIVKQLIDSKLTRVFTLPGILLASWKCPSELDPGKLAAGRTGPKSVFDVLNGTVPALGRNTTFGPFTL